MTISCVELRLVLLSRTAVGRNTPPSPSRKGWSRHNSHIVEPLSRSRALYQARLRETHQESARRVYALTAIASRTRSCALHQDCTAKNQPHTPALLPNGHTASSSSLMIRTTNQLTDFVSRQGKQTPIPKRYKDIYRYAHVM